MADISPDLAARIESLKASHAENPARFFMPLASAWREAGELGKAEELLRENLKRHPGYLSAHVLLGRCLADRGALAEARNEFQYVLSVDPQNLIALKTLGDMAAAQGQGDEARKWYNGLLSVDPMNADARQALHLLDTQPAPPPPPPAEPKPNDDFGMVDLAGAADASGGEPADFGSWGSVGLDAGTGDIAPAGEGAAEDSARAWGETSLDAEPAAWESAPASAGDADSWGQVDLDAAGSVQDFAPSRGDEAGGFDALDFGAVDPSTAETTFETSAPEPAAASGFDGWGSVDDGQLGAASSTPPLEGLEAFSDAPVIGAHEAHDGHDAHEGEEEEVVTETMAELYARQGFLDRAAEVYRELISRRGAEPALVRRLEELEARIEGAAPSPTSSPYDLDTDEEEEAGPPAWLQAVDAASTASDDRPVLPDLGFGTTLPELDLSTDLAAPPIVAAEEAHALADAAGASPFPISAEEPTTADFAVADAGFGGSTVDASDAAFAESTGDPFADSFARGFGEVEGEDALAFDVAASAETGRAAWEPPTVEETEPVPGLIGEAPAFAVDTSAVDDSAHADFDEAPAASAADLDQSVDAEPADISALAEDVSIFAEPIDFAAAAGDAPPAGSAPVASAPSIKAYMSSLLTWRPGSPASAATAFAPSEPELAPYEAPAGEPRPGYDAPADEPSPPFEAPTEDNVSPYEAPAEDDAAPYDAPADDHPAHEDEPWATGAQVAEAPAASQPAPWEIAAPAEDEPWAIPSAGATASPDDEPWAAAPADESGSADEVGEDLPWMNAELDAPAAGETAAPEGFEAMDRPPSSAPAAEGPRGDDLMPWDSPFDLAGEAEVAPVADRAAPRTEPTVQDAGGFSFEEFFGAPAAEPAAGPASAPALETRADLEPVYQPEPEPRSSAAPPAASSGAPGGEDDEDLESFQAWLQSLKR